MDPYAISVFSPREGAVASLLLAGLTTAEIVERLGLRRATVVGIIDRIEPWPVAGAR